MGYLLAKDLLPEKGKSEIPVKLVVPSKVLAMLYKEKFKKKMSQADERIKIDWIDLPTFREKWKANPEGYKKAIVICDEGDHLLSKDISHDL